MRCFGVVSEIEDDVSAVTELLEAGEAHLVAGRESLGVGEIGVQLLIGPLAPVTRQRIRVLVAFSCGNRTPDDVPEVGANLVLAPLLDAVTRLALAKHLGALLCVGGSERRRDAGVGRGRFRG